MKAVFRILLCAAVALSLMAPAAFAAADKDTKKDGKKTEQPADKKEGKKGKKGKASELDS
jgi:hypothetical protein